MEDRATADIGSADHVTAVHDEVIDSATLARLLEEVRNADGPQQPAAYNRMHNRHNRS